MIRLKITNKNNYLYSLKDSRDNTYELSIEFFDIEEKPQIGDYISMSAELLNPRYAGYSTDYSFGSLTDEYGKKEISLNDIDVIKIETVGKEILLKRLYG